MKQVHKGLICVLISCMLLVSSLLTSGQNILPAFADGATYTGVLEDLQKDSEFNADDYPEKSDDYSVSVIQIAESTNGELFVYTYQPSMYPFTVTDINMALSESLDGTRLYSLRLLDCDGVFCKYVVRNFSVSKDTARYYNITSIYREWVKGIDDEPSEGNVISKVSFEVGKLYGIMTNEDGTVSYGCKKCGTIEVTEKFVGFWRYKDNAVLNTYTDSHFVAFNTDIPIDDLYEAEIEYFVKHVDTSDIDTFYPKQRKHDVIKAEQEGSNDPFWFHKKYTWKRIGRAEDLIQKQGLGDTVKRELKNKAWVLYFLETEYASWVDKPIGGITLFVQDRVEEVTILRLKFETEGTVYNLGVVDNAQTGSPLPVNSQYPEKVGFWRYVWNCIVKLFKGTATLSEQIVAVVVIFLVVLALPILLLVLSIFFPGIRGFLSAIVKGIGAFFVWVFKAVFWLILLPFKGIAALVRKIKKE